MKKHTLFYRMLTALTLLALLLPLSPSPSLSAQQKIKNKPIVPEALVSPDAPITARPMDIVADTVSPSPITNLVAETGTSLGTVELSWVATGDDATAGTASTYAVRYNITVITETTWAASTDVSGEPSPSPAGTVESMTVTGLTPGQTYHFAIKTEDEVPNTSSISNSPRATAQTSPNTVYLPLVVSSFSGGVPTVIPETTEVLTETTTEHLDEISGDGAVFTFTQSTSSLDALETGDVMVSDATTNAPSGFLRKVTAVSSDGAQVVVETENATIEEAIQQGAVSISKCLTPADIESMTALSGVMLLSPAETTLEDSFFFEIKDVVLYDEDGDHNTTDDQLKANGSLELAPGFDFALAVEDQTLEELEFVFNVEETVELEFQAEVELESVELYYEIARLHLGTITVFVGPVPVVFLIEMPIYVRGDGDVSVGITTSVTQQADLSAGLRYQDGNWSPVSSLSNDFGFDPPRLSADANFKGYIDPPLSLMLYGVAGPFAGVTPYLELEADVFADPWWELYGGIDATVGVKGEVLGHSLGDHTEVVVGYKILLAQAQSNNPPDMPFSPFPVNGAIVQDLNSDLSWSGGDQDGDAVTYDVYFEADDGTPDVLLSNDQSSTAYDPGTLAPNTHYYWRIVAKDERGATTAGPVWSFTTGTEEPCSITLTLQSPQVSDLTATLSGTVASDCSTITRLNWQWGDGQDDDQWFPASHTYAVTGAYPITVTAYNDLGDTETGHTTAYVGTASGEMVTVPAGEFQMGCDDTNPSENCYSNEQPLHTVYLDEYAIDKYEVTNAQYAEFLNAEGNQSEGGDTWLDADDSHVRIHESGGVWQVDTGYEDHPVVEVTWYGARAYCQWQGKRLPSEAEWEKAARGASDTRMYSWGNEDPDCSRLNYHCGAGYCVGDTTPVGSYPSGASPYGALDMAGNVWEWVNDWYDYNYYSTYPVDGWPNNPTGPDSGGSRVLRGGGWPDNWYSVRVANRYYTPSSSYSNFGFRCVGVAPGP